MANRSAFGLAVALATAGCILVVNEQTPNGDQFSGDACVLLSDAGSDGGACGACLMTSCSGPVTACCGDSDCRTMLPALDACANQGSCDPTALPTKVASCMTAKCATACNTNDAGSEAASFGIACSDYPQGTDGCICKWTNAPNSTYCSSYTYTDGICCKDATWPAASTGCFCASYGCTTDGFGDCDCSIGGSTGTAPGSCTVGNGFLTCCVSTSTIACYCSASNDTCNTGFKPTTSCDVDLFCANFGWETAKSCR